jgi:hypothetical protein
MYSILQLTNNVVLSTVSIYHFSNKSPQTSCGHGG